MRISDWSSDVCSSDLHRTANALEFRCALQLRPLARIAVVTAALKPLDRCPADDGFKGRALDLDPVKIMLGLAVDTDFHRLSLPYLSEGDDWSYNYEACRRSSAGAGRNRGSLGGVSIHTSCSKNRKTKK